jgi:predicted outer membrane repeat protein
MRISTVYAELESTKNSIHEQVIPHRRSYRDNNENHLHIPDEMDPISPNFMYRDTDFIANDAKKRGGGVYGKGFV